MEKNDVVPMLESERLRLRGHSIEDFKDSAEMWGDSHVVAQISGHTSTKEQSWSRLLRYTGHWLHLGFGYWVVETKFDHRFIGEVGLADYCRHTKPSIKGIPEAGWVLRSDAFGKGYATEAVETMLCWADSELKAEKTVCIVAPTHTASINVARKNGYRNEILGEYGARETLFMERSRRRT